MKNRNGKIRCVAGGMALLLGMQVLSGNTTKIQMKENIQAASLSNEEGIHVATGPAVTTGVAVVTDDSISGTPLPDKEDTVTFRATSYTIPYGWTRKIACTIPSAMKKYTFVYTSSNTKVAKVDKNGIVTGVSTGKAKITVEAKEDADIKASYSAVVKREKEGWHTTASGKKYYVTEDKERAIGYFKVKGSYYYAAANSYIITDKWKYVEIDKKKYKLYFGSDGKQKQNVSALIGEQEQYKIEVNISKNTVIVYAKDGKKGYTIPVKAMVCSCGIKGHTTITGSYSKLREAGKWHPLYYGTYGKYCTRISGPYLFHSVVYKKYGDNYSLNADEFLKLGEPASHGCIRLQVKDAKWIYNRSNKCSVTLYKGKEQLPLKKPKAAKPVTLKGNKAYDPTDVDVK